ncbi:type IV toxin-antitoxin system AbiEi family antitoxin domain-containing protein [Sphingobacterium arenae]|uniref:Type IV toxin-antitoxin system AbiEi family antitoxin n=1 Tax=Sphingobacterium arenae TaxID=1280598 RepID=A0ABR7Y318_9SPHI|nr:type IV toxin-antitoxin system AbiEi family antitoxin [Sphingobacterium arenae]MBD1425697.1 type IV toxin-antitoxin system AbiEi family antitoxin [Sphingobacterium arenae]
MAEQYKYLNSFIDEQRANGKYSFTTEGLHSQLGVSENALKKTLQRLKKQESVVMVRRGFYVIVPPEYRAKGIIPTSLYVNDLMKFLNRDYYVGLLNAAAYHGAAHQQPQNYSVITEGIALRPIKNDKVGIHFYIKKSWNKADIIKKKVDTGYINISSPELTALDLVSYYNEVGGFNRVATVIEELKDVIQPEKLVETAKRYDEISVVQRLGYVLDCVLEENELSNALYNYLNSIEYYPTLLRPQKKKPENMITGNKWKIVPNVEIEADI